MTTNTKASLAASGPRIGLDFGTCFTAAARCDGENPAPLPLSDTVDGQAPTCLFLDGDTWLAGVEAENAALSAPERFRREFKRQLGQAAPLHVGPRLMPADSLAAEFLKGMRWWLPKSSDAVVLTVPATFQASRREQLRAAAMAAGFARVDLLIEPVAVAIDHVAAAGDAQGKTFLVYDLGGGTFDLAVVRCAAGGWELLAAGGLPECGGIDIDQAITADVMELLTPEQRDRLSPLNDSADALREQLALKAFVRDLKHDLSEKASLSRKVPLPGGPRYKLTRERLEQLSAPLLDATLAYCRQLLTETGIAADSVDAVLLSGATCKLPFVGRRVREGLRLPVTLVDEPKLAVARGAARRGRVLDRVQADLRSAAERLVEKHATAIASSLAPKLIEDGVRPAMTAWRTRDGVFRLNDLGGEVRRRVERAMASAAVKAQLKDAMARFQKELRAEATRLLAPLCREYGLDPATLTPKAGAIERVGDLSGLRIDSVLDVNRMEIMAGIIAGVAIALVVASGPLAILGGVLAAVFGTDAIGGYLAGVDMPVFSRKLLCSDAKIGVECAKAQVQIAAQLATQLRGAEGPFAGLPDRVAESFTQAAVDACEQIETPAQRAA
jgi:hypothetical protein